MCAALEKEGLNWRENACDKSILVLNLLSGEFFSSAMKQDVLQVVCGSYSRNQAS